MDEKLLKTISDAFSLNTKVMREMSEELGALRKEVGSGGTLYKTAATSHTAQTLHGSGGIWSSAGLERDIITAHVRPQGFSDMLPLIGAVEEDPRFGSLTGITGAVGSQPTAMCDDAPVSYVKGCNLTARFGRIRFDTDTIDISTAIRKLHRGDFTDLMLRGRVLGLTDVGPNVTEDNMLNILTKSAMVTVGVMFERELTRQLWQGVTTVPFEFPGLDVQIATGQKDADSGVLCPALDSDVKNYGYTLLDATIVDYIAMLETYIFHNARKMGLMPATWAWVMRPELWEELTAIYPCAYYTNKCATSMTDANANVSVDGREMTAVRDSMRNGMYIEVNGRRYPVVTDDGIFEHNNTNNANCDPGQYASTIYFVPLTITGGFPVTYRQYLNYNMGAGDLTALRGNETFWTDGGIYGWAMEQVKWCYKLAARTEQRVILRTPQLAGRIDAVKYQPLQHLRDSMPSSPYWSDGGVSIRPGLNDAYAVWSGR